MQVENSSEKLFELHNVTKSFGNIVAIEDISFEVYRNEIVGLVGDNGAGKSTLLKVMTGFFSPDRGDIKFKGQSIQFNSPRKARSLGIETVYQDLALISDMSMWRNYFLGREIKVGKNSLQILAIKRMRDITIENLHEIGLTRLRSADEPVKILSGGERQALAISRAHYFGGSVLLLDEPTSALSVKETEKVLEATQKARNTGMGVVVIDHNIANVHKICDRIVVLEHGRVIKSFCRDDFSVSQVAEMVAGRHVNL